MQLNSKQQYFNILTKETGVIVGASDDETGNIKYGGDWVLESTNENIVNKTLNGVNYVIDESYITKTHAYQIPYDHISINITKIYYGLPYKNNLKNQNQNLIYLVVEGVKNMKPNYDNNYDTTNRYENFVPNNFYFEVFVKEPIDTILQKEIINVFLSLLN